jgi:hypothetical protein
MNVWQSVKVKNETHSRYEQAGTVHATNAETHPDEVQVKFDLDGTVESVLIADLVAL